MESFWLIMSGGASGAPIDGSRFRQQALRASRRRMIRSLTDLSIQHGQQAQAEAILQEHVIRFPGDQDALFHLVKLLITDERIAEAREYYQRCKVALASSGKEPAEHLKALEEHFRTHVEHVTNLSIKPLTAPPKLLTHQYGEIGPSSLHANSETPVPFAYNHAQDIMRRVGENEEQPSTRSLDIVTAHARENGDELNRREAAKTIGTFGLQLFGIPLWEQFSKALTTTSSLDGSTIEAYTKLTQNFWRLSETAAPSLLISPVVGHFEMITQFLRDVPPLAFYQPLSSLAAEVAQIAARLFFDMKGYKDSTTFYDLSIELAQRAGNPVLQTVGIVRKARDLLQIGNPQEGYAQLQSAPQLSTQPGAAIAKAYLAAVEAKASSQLGESRLCLQKLHEAAQLVEKGHPDEDFYWTSFDASLLGDFQGDCYLQLHRLPDAQKAFQEALQPDNSSSLRHQASVTVGLANVFMQEGELEKSCHFVNQALDATLQTQSWMILQYILAFRHRLDTWQGEPCVKYLDEHINHVSRKLPNVAV